MIKKFYPTISLLFVLLILPINWYTKIIAGDAYKNVNGIFVFTKLHGIIALTYCFCIFIQYFSNLYKKYLLPILPEIALLIILTLFPYLIYENKLANIFIFLPSLYYGFYLALALIICCIALNIIYFAKNRNIK